MKRSLGRTGGNQEDPRIAIERLATDLTSPEARYPANMLL